MTWKEALTVEAVPLAHLPAVRGIPLGPEPSVLQPERSGDGVEHAQAARQPQARLGEPKATDGVLQQSRWLHPESCHEFKVFAKAVQNELKKRRTCSRGRDVNEPFVI